MTTKKVILLSAATYFALNTITWLIGWLIWPIGFLAVWLFLGHIARKMSSLTHIKDDKAWNYIICNLVPPIVIMILFLEDSEKFLKRFNLPKFRNPFVWPEKEEK
jgi:hypothetical protein